MQAGALILSFFILFDSSMIYLIYTTDIPPIFFLFSMYHEQAHITAMKVFFTLFLILFGDFELNTEIDSRMGRSHHCIVAWMLWKFAAIIPLVS